MCAYAKEDASENDAVVDQKKYHCPSLVVVDPTRDAEFRPSNVLRCLLGCCEIPDGHQSGVGYPEEKIAESDEF